MTKRETYHERLDKILNVFLKDETPVVLETSTLEDGTIIEYANLEIGTPVMVIVEGADPTPVADGEYKISETQTIVVASGVIAEVKEEAVEADPEVEVEQEGEPVETAEAPVEDMAAIFNLDKLKSIIDLTKDGFHTISLSVANGKIEWGNIYSESFQELQSQLKLAKEEAETAKIKFEEDLKILGQAVKDTKVIQAPVEGKEKPATYRDVLMNRIGEQRKEKATY